MHTARCCGNHFAQDPLKYVLLVYCYSRFVLRAVDIFTRYRILYFYHFFLFASLPLMSSDGLLLIPDTYIFVPQSVMLPQKQATASFFLPCLNFTFQLLACNSMMKGICHADERTSTLPSSRGLFYASSRLLYGDVIIQAWRDLDHHVLVSWPTKQLDR